MPSKFLPPRRRSTHLLIWLIAIICTILAIAVIIAGIVVFIGYLVMHPRIPVMSVVGAHLDLFQYDEAGLLETQVTIVIRMRNGNAKAGASFSDTSVYLFFDGLKIAQLVADPFEVSKNSSVDFNYVVESRPVPLDPELQEFADTSLKKDVVRFDLKGGSRTRWRIGAASGHNNDGYEYDVIGARVDGYDDNFGYKANLYMQMGISSWVLTALQRESLYYEKDYKHVQLEENLCEMQLELENLVWDRKILEDHLQAAIRERKILESMFAELEDEHDKAIEKIELLERELQDLKDETVQLKEICGKELWSFAGHDRNNEKKGFVADEYGIPYGIPSWKGSDIILRDMMKHKDTCENENKSNAELLTHLGTGLAPGTIPRNLDMNEVYNQRKAVAISQSLFSAVLSLLVGMTIWEAQDPCMPLVVALFTVVGMSLRSVIQLFSTIKNKPASDAVALLSFNWFILGTLTYPTLPKVARVLAPWALRFICRTMNWFGISLH
ncbi:hypothetical protein WN943_007252 [Citrus x changshan-huyou]